MYSASLNYNDRAFGHLPKSALCVIQKPLKCLKYQLMQFDVHIHRYTVYIIYIAQILWGGRVALIILGIG